MVAMLLGREDLRDRFIKVVSSGQLNLATEALDDAARRVSRYLLMQLVVNASYGIPIGLGLYFIGIPNAPLWGLLATLLRFIPFLGPWIAASFPVVLSVAIDPGWTMIIATLALFVLMEIISNNIIEVWLYGAGTGISNLALLVAAIFWTALWGPVGLVLSTPLTVCLLVLGRHMPGLRFLSTLLGSEPVLDPPAQLYQRMLSRDFDEMLQLANEYIENHSLTSFYDDVFLPALLMAEHDRHRGALAEVRQQFIFTAGRELIEELEQRGETDNGDATVERSSETRTPPPADAICCIPAADDADELVGLMARHLLAERGYHTVVCPVTASPDEQRDAIRNASAKVAFVSALPPSALVPAQRARRQLKRAVPDLRVIVGVWTSHATSVAYKDRLGRKRAEATVRSLAELLAEIARTSPVAESLPSKDTPALVSKTQGQRPLRLTDSEPEAWVERVTRAAAQLFDIPVSLVFLLPEDELFWPERLGVTARTESLLDGFLKEAAGDDDLIVVDDVLDDKRLAQTAFVRERGVRRLVNVVLRAEAGNIVGHLCLVDTKPATTDAEQRETIVTIGRELVDAVTTLHRSEAVPG
jgi:PAS domain-containing protein